MSVSVEMVKSLVVKSYFPPSEQSLNCEYEISLTDNRFAAGRISSQKLRSLIKRLDKEKVFFQAPVSRRDFKGETLREAKVEQEKSTLSNTVLSEIFQDNVSQKFPPRPSATKSPRLPITLDYAYNSFSGIGINVKVPDRFLSANDDLIEDFVLIEREYVQELKELNLSQLFQMAENKASRICEPDLTEPEHCYVLSKSEFTYIQFLKYKISKNGNSEWAAKDLEGVKNLLITFLENVRSCDEENKET